jgi:hypothetical protein
MGRKKGGRA